MILFSEPALPNLLNMYVRINCKLLCVVDLCKFQKEPSFGADTDEEDDEKDDNLLPM